MDKWIKCSDQLPKSDVWRKSVIIYGSPQCGTHSADWQVMEAFYLKEDKSFEFGEYDCPIEVTHWMPLPPPPKG